MIEEWRDIIGFEACYQVSNLGRVRSLDRRVTFDKVDQYSGRTISVTKSWKGRVLRPGTVKSGHQFVVLGRTRGKGNGRFVHALVLTAFVGPAPIGTECCHGDGNAANNHLANLRWDTRLANVHDMMRHGTHRWQREARV